VEALRGALESETPIGAEEPAKRTNEETPRQTKQEKRPQKTAKLTEPSPELERNSEAKRKGAAQTRTNKGSAASKGRASASTGSSINYAAIVRARVASRKPAGGGKRGTVVIAFGVSRSGGLSFASVSRSSGDPSLDRSVLAAVRGAGPFPVPPPGAGLRFAMPFYFK
jgi:protein TonB